MLGPISCTVGDGCVSFYAVYQNATPMRDLRVTREVDGEFHGVRTQLVETEPSYFAGTDLASDEAKLEWMCMCVQYTKQTGVSLRELLGLQAEWKSIR